jgi:hypothetical protein
VQTARRCTRDAIGRGPQTHPDLSKVMNTIAATQWAVHRRESSAQSTAHIAVHDARWRFSTLKVRRQYLRCHTTRTLVFVVCRPGDAVPVGSSIDDVLNVGAEAIHLRVLGPLVRNRPTIGVVRRCRFRRVLNACRNWSFMLRRIAIGPPTRIRFAASEH